MEEKKKMVIKKETMFLGEVATPKEVTIVMQAKKITQIITRVSLIDYLFNIVPNYFIYLKTLLDINMSYYLQIPSHRMMRLVMMMNHSCLITWMRWIHRILWITM